MKRAPRPSNSHLPVNISAADRAKTYPEKLYESDGLLFCKACSKAIDHRRLDTVKHHLFKSAVHAANEAKIKKQEETGPGRGIKRQKTIGETFSNATKAADHRKEMASDLIKTFAACNIPLEKVNNPHFRSFLLKHVQGGGAVASASTLRKSIDTMDLHGAHKAKLKAIVSKAPSISIVTDETQDAKGQFVLNVLVVPCLTTSFAENLADLDELLGQFDATTTSNDKLNPATKEKSVSVLKPLLIETVFLTAVNHATVGQAIIKILSNYDINFDNVVGFLSDNAKYMLKSFNDILSAVCANCVHVTCWAHILNLVGETFRANFEIVDRFVAKMKKVFKNSARRKVFYVNFLKEKGVKKPHTPPQPVITRWNSWFEAVVQHNEYFKYYEEMMNEMAANENSVPPAVEAVLEIMAETRHLELLLRFITVKSQRIRKLIKMAESQDIQVHLIYNTMSDLLTWATASTDTDYNTLTAGQGIPKKTAKEVGSLMKECMQACEDKLRNYVEHDSQPGIAFLKAVRALDPKQAFLFKDRFEELVEDIPYLKHVLQTKKQTIASAKEEFAIYIKEAAYFTLRSTATATPAPVATTSSNQESELDESDSDESADEVPEAPTTKKDAKPTNSAELLLFWNSLKERVPTLYGVAMSMLSVPINSADAERSFSSYNTVLTDRRHRLTQEHLSFFSAMYFNGRYGIL